MVRVSFLLCLCISAGASAQIYRWVDADGQTHYSDRPHPKSDPVAIEHRAAIGGARGAAEALAEGPLLGPYRRFAIVSPESNQTLRLDRPSLPVNLLLEPPLMVGHRLELWMDGAPIENDGPIGTEVLVKDVSQGSHWAEARVLDAAGIVARSAPVTFQLRVPLPPGVIP